MMLRSVFTKCANCAGTWKTWQSMLYTALLAQHTAKVCCTWTAAELCSTFRNMRVCKSAVTKDQLHAGLAHFDMTTTPRRTHQATPLYESLSYNQTNLPGPGAP